jgi:exopolysaccharide production protein ExoQ
MIKLRQIEKVAHFLMLFILVEAFLPLRRVMTAGEFDPFEGDPLFRSLILVGYLILIPIILLQPQRVFRMVLQSPHLWLLVLLAFISIFWSGVPDLTLRRSAAVLLTSLYGVTLAVRFSLDEILELLGWVLGLCMLLSLFFILLIPDWGIDLYQGDYVWRGIFAHKNGLGNRAVLTVLVLLTLLRRKGDHPYKVWLWRIGIGLAVVLLMGSQSATALVLFGALIAGAVLLLLLYRLRRSWQVVLPTIFILMGLGAIVLIENNETILAFFGRGATLTGRIPLWLNILPLAMERFWLGYGFSSFWLGWEGPSAQIWAVSGWQPGYSHNGFLDLWLNLGMVGVILAIVLLLDLFIYSLLLYIRKNSDAQFWILFLVVIIMLNMVEGALLRTNSIWWVLLVYYASRRNIRFTSKAPEVKLQLAYE